MTEVAPQQVDVDGDKSSPHDVAPSPPAWERNEKSLLNGSAAAAKVDPAIDPRLSDPQDNIAVAPSKTPESRPEYDERRFADVGPKPTEYQFYPPSDVRRADPYGPQPPDMHSPPFEGHNAHNGYNRSVNTSHRYEPYPSHQPANGHQYTPAPGMPIRRSPSSAASGVNTPEVRRTPPPPGHYGAPPPTYDSRGPVNGYHYGPPPPPPEGYEHGYPPRQDYPAPPPPPADRYYAPGRYYHDGAAPSVPSQMPHHANVQLTYTDDSSTKLTEFVRRRCFNCCTTDTSTWRRSNITPGKVLCNKCGLFERTHRKPRPDQLVQRKVSTGRVGLEGGHLPPPPHMAHAHHGMPPPHMMGAPMHPYPPQQQPDPYYHPQPHPDHYAPPPSQHYRLRDPANNEVKHEPPPQADFQHHGPPPPQHPEADGEQVEAKQEPKAEAEA